MSYSIHMIIQRVSCLNIISKTCIKDILCITAGAHHSLPFRINDVAASQALPIYPDYNACESLRVCWQRGSSDYPSDCSFDSRVDDLLYCLDKDCGVILHTRVEEYPP